MRKLLLGLVAAALAVSAGGCLFVEGRYRLAVDGAMDANLELGVLKAFMEEGKGPDMDAMAERLAEGKWEATEFDREQWHVFAYKGHAGPGETLFETEGEEKVEPVITTYLFSTTYELTMPLQPPGEPAEMKMEMEGELQEPGEMAEAMQAFMSMMAGADEAGMRFSLELPGTIIEANGDVVAPGVASWSLDLTAMQEEKPDDMFARSRLLNWQSIGRMGAELNRVGRYDLVPVLVAGVERGLVPDPETDVPLEAELDVEVYAQILDIMLALDATVGPDLTNIVMGALKLNQDKPDAAAVERILGRVTAQDFAASVQKGVASALVEQLGAP